MDESGTGTGTERGNRSNRARLALEEIGRAAFPVIINHMKHLDFATEEGFRNGDLCQKTLEHICHGINFGWDYGREDKHVLFNKKVVRAWATQWERAQDNIEYWIKMTKLDDKDPSLAKRLRQEFSDNPELVEELDELDVD